MIWGPEYRDWEDKDMYLWKIVFLKYYNDYGIIKDPIIWREWKEVEKNNLVYTKKNGPLIGKESPMRDVMMFGKKENSALDILILSKS